MSLTTALNNAQAIFNNTGTQSSVVSNNIANAGNADYTRRQAMLTTDMAGAQVVKIARANEPSLQKAFLGSTSDDAAQQRLLKGYEDIQSGTIGGNKNEIAPSTYLAALQTAMQTFAGSPASTTAAQSAINAAQDLANSLNNATTAVNGIRTGADKEISSGVDSLNSLLQQFQQANDAVKTATATAGPTSSALSDAMDQRDSVLKQISQIVGVTTVTRDNGDMALYTSGGATLFETIPRQVTFTPTNSYTDGTVGNNVYIDGVVLDPGQGADTTAQGSLQAALQVRDDVAPTYQKQLDEISRGLVTMFSEKNQTDSSQPALPGLFTWSGGTVPTDTTAVAGMAGTIAVNPALITSQGGDPTLLRDGGINGSDYVVNPSGDSGYSGLLDSYVTGLDTKMDFDPSAGSDTKASIMDYASNSIGWLEDQRSSANTAAENTSAALSRSSEVYSNQTGVNLDEELTLMMDIEQSYKAGTKILNAVNQMLQSVLDIAS
ncbi:flagellar hook-associated protein FlgK [Rhizobium calliandrae]|uniref:Flagellar hook-associated protein 1 n=1 Tax=Rhizobium calliandrae TaxID=1312182 RepID=A0ABT7K8C1_9HYPH|nr:flagellar hook-associated protein FlgK [Rhizobium calliandrae]MDL2404845.1 flagellar hook-associated protein FlgK [Rhizobium calliandrae]